MPSASSSITAECTAVLPLQPLQLTGIDMRPRLPQQTHSCKLAPASFSHFKQSRRANEIHVRMLPDAMKKFPVSFMELPCTASFPASAQRTKRSHKTHHCLVANVMLADSNKGFLRCTQHPT
jgi:hypothetical protein